MKADLQKTYARPIYGNDRAAQVLRILQDSGKLSKGRPERGSAEFWDELIERLPIDTLREVEKTLEEWGEERQKEEAP